MEMGDVMFGQLPCPDLPWSDSIIRLWYSSSSSIHPAGVGRFSFRLHGGYPAGPEQVEGLGGSTVVIHAPRRAAGTSVGVVVLIRAQHDLGAHTMEGRAREGPCAALATVARRPSTVAEIDHGLILPGSDDTEAHVVSIWGPESLAQLMLQGVQMMSSLPTRVGLVAIHRSPGDPLPGPGSDDAEMLGVGGDVAFPIVDGR